MHHTIQPKRFAFLMGVLLMLAACGSDTQDNSQPPSSTCTQGELQCECAPSGSCNAGLECIADRCISPDMGAPMTQTIGPEGGRVTFEGVSLTFPAGALQEDKEITIRRAVRDLRPEYVVYGSYYEFGPEGLAFDKPVQVTLPRAMAPLEASIFWTLKEGDGFEALSTRFESGEAIAEMNHFSGGFVGTPDNTSMTRDMEIGDDMAIDAGIDMGGLDDMSAASDMNSSDMGSGVDACEQAVGVPCDAFDQAYIKGSNSSASDLFGSKVALDGNTLAVSALGADSKDQAGNVISNTGGVYVFTRLGRVWSQQAYLTASNADTGDLFGASIALDGDTLVVGARDESSSAAGVNGDPMDNTSFESGAAYVFTRSGDTWSQQAYLKASNTDRQDQFGSSVALDGDTLAVGAPREASLFTGVNSTGQGNNSEAVSGAVYLFVRSGSVWSQQAYIKASNTNSGDQFGSELALDNGTLAVTSAFERSAATGVNGDQADNSADRAGAVYVFTRSGSRWSQQAYIKASNTDANDRFGNSLALSEDTLVVGAAGENGGSAGVNGDQASNTVSQSGAVYLFTRTGVVWSQQAYLKASNPGEDQFGGAVAIHGDTLAVGANFEDSSATGVNGNQADDSARLAGAVYLFTRSADVWRQTAYIKASNTDAGDLFGRSVALDRDTLVIGATRESSIDTGINGDQTDNSSTNSGAVYVRTFTPPPEDPCEQTVGISCTQFKQTYLKASNAQEDDAFGVSMALDGDTLVVGAPGEDSAATGVDGDQTDNSALNSGAVYVFVRTGDVWTQQAYLKASNAQEEDVFGGAVAIDGDTLVVRATGEDSSAAGVDGDQTDNSLRDSGAVYVFTRTNNVWTQQAYLKASNPDELDAFGLSLALSGDTLAVGSSQEDSSATGVNGDQTDNSEFNSGAVYIFTRTGAVWSQQAYLKASNAQALDAFGVSLAIDGERLAVGATREASSTKGVDGDQTNNAAADAGAVYLFERSGDTWSQMAYIKASNTENGDGFGESVDLSGNTLAVGTRKERSASTSFVGNQEDNSLLLAGAVYIFEFSQNTWSQQAYLKPSAVDEADNFGKSLALDGDRLMVGAPGEDGAGTGVNGSPSDNSAPFSGAAYLFVRSNGVWNQQAYIKAPNTESGDGFGDVVALKNDTLVVAAPSEASSATGINGNQAENSARGAGAVYAQKIDLRSAPPANDACEQVLGISCAEYEQAYIKASNTNENDRFASAVALDANTLVIGAPGESSSATGVGGDQANNSATSSGAVYVFVRTGDVWAQQAYLKASNAQANDLFGSSVAISRNTLVVGAIGEGSGAAGVNGDQMNNTASGAGAAYVFLRRGDVWTQQAYLKASNAQEEDAFGASVAIEGNLVAVGAANEDSNSVGINGLQNNDLAADAGAVYLFERSGTTWTQSAYLKASNTDAGDLFGSSLSLSSNTLAVGAPAEQSNATGIDGDQANNAISGAGATYVFVRSSAGAWRQQAYLKPSRTTNQGLFGHAVALDGDTLAVGAPGNNSEATGINGDQADFSASEAGAVYAFTRVNDVWSQQAYIKASRPSAGDKFGAALALSGSRLIVGATGEDSGAKGFNGDELLESGSLNAGAAYLFERPGDSWYQRGYIKASNTAILNEFGASVAIDDDILVVGSIEERSGATGIGGNQADFSASKSGAAYVRKIEP